MASPPPGFVLEQPTGPPPGFEIETPPEPAQEPSSIRDFLINAGAEFDNVKSFVIDSLLAGAETEALTNFSIPAEARERIAQGVGDERQRRQNVTVANEQALEPVRDRSPAASLAGQIVGGAASLPLPGGGLARGLLRSAGVGAGQGAVGGAVEPASSAQERLENIGIGAGVGAVTGGAVDVGASAVRRGVNAAQGGVADETAAEVLEQGERFDVPVFADDVLPNKTLRVASEQAEKVPVVGTARGRGEQNAKQQIAAGNFSSDIAESLGGDSPDLFSEIQGGLRSQLDRFKKAASSRYERVGAQLDSAGPVDVGRFRALAGTLIEEESARGSRASREVIGLLESFRDAPEGAFTDMIALRSDLGDEIASFFTGKNEVIGAKGVEKLQQLRSELTAAMTGFADRVDPEAGALWRKADNFYRRNVVPFKETALKRFVNNEEPEKALAFILGNAGPAGGVASRAKLFHKSLSTRGRTAVRAAIIERAIDAGTREGRAFSPQAFANELERIRNVIPVFFRGQEGRDIKGIKTLMEHTARSQRFATSPSTGQQLLLTALTAGQAVEAVTTGTAGTAAIAGSAAAITRFLTQSSAGKRLVLAASDQTPGSPELDSILERLGSASTVGGARAASQPPEPDDQNGN